MRLSFVVHTLVYSVYTLKRNAIGFQERFPCSSFAELAELLGVFISKTTIKSDRFQMVNSTVTNNSFSHHRTVPRMTHSLLSKNLKLPLLPSTASQLHQELLV